MGKIYDLGQLPRPALVRFIRSNGSTSVDYLVTALRFELPDDVVAAEIRHAPCFPYDYPAADEPGWGTEAQDGGAVQRVQVRGRDRFQPPGGH
jgi:hypothetical protein